MQRKFKKSQRSYKNQTWSELAGVGKTAHKVKLLATHT